MQADSRIRTTGIPKSGLKKPLHNDFTQKSPVSNAANFNSTHSQFSVMKNPKSHKIPPSNRSKSPFKSLLSQYQSRASKQTNLKNDERESSVKPNSELLSKSTDSSKKLEYKGSFSLGRSPKSGNSTSASRERAHLPTNGDAATIGSGIGIGGGSVAQNTFSYVPSNSSIRFSKNAVVKSNTLTRSSSSNVKSPSRFDVSLSSFRRKSGSQMQNSSTNDSKDDTVTNDTITDSTPVAVLKQRNAKYGQSLATNNNVSGSQIDQAPCTKQEITAEHTGLNSTLTNERKKVSSDHNFGEEKQKDTSEIQKPTYATSSLNRSFMSKLNRSFKGNRPKPVNCPTVPERESNNSLVKDTASLKLSTSATKIISPSTKHISAFEPVKVPKKSATVPQESSLQKDEVDTGEKQIFLSQSGLNKGNTKPKSNVSQGLHTVPRSKPSKLLEVHTNGSMSKTTKSKGSTLSFVSRLTKTSKSSPLSFPKNEKLSKQSSSKAVESFSNKTSHNPAFSKPIVKSNHNHTKTMQASGNELNSAMKSSNLVKSNSGSSIFTDSSTSNLSGSASLRRKKVSFQSDVTVCDGNGISTFSNALRGLDVDDGLVSQSINENLAPNKAAEELSHFASHVINVSRSWCDENLPHHNHSSYQSELDPRNDAFDLKNAPEYKQLSDNSSYQEFNDLPTVEEGGSFVDNMNSPLNYSYSFLPQNAPPNGFETDSRFIPNINKEYALSCESPVPFVICQPNCEQEPQEHDVPPERIPKNTMLLPDYLNANMRATQQTSFCHPDFNSISFTPHTSNDLQDTYLTLQSEASYFQTQSRANSSNEQYLSYEVPYYECCTMQAPTSNADFNSSEDQFGSLRRQPAGTFGKIVNVDVQSPDGVREVSVRDKILQTHSATEGFGERSKGREG